MSNKIEEVYGKNLFHDEVLKERLPAETYEALQRTIQDGAELEPQTADVIADAMMKWAVERGATHYPLVSAFDRHHGGKARILY